MDTWSPEERQLRIELAAAYRLAALYGWTDLVFTHISARIPGPEHHFLINPYGMLFDEITASSLVKVDQHCNKLSDSPYPVNPAGFVIHSCIHAAREDAVRASAAAISALVRPSHCPKCISRRRGSACSAGAGRRWIAARAEAAARIAPAVSQARARSLA